MQLKKINENDKLSKYEEALAKYQTKIYDAQVR